MISAFIFPGAGQWVQNRRAAAALYIVPTLALCVVLVWMILKPVFISIGYAMNRPGIDESDLFGAGDFLRLVTSRQVLFLLAAGLLIHALNILDAALAYKRRLRKWEESHGG